MDRQGRPGAGADPLEKRIDSKCNFFKFGYQLGYIGATIDPRPEMAGKDGRSALMARDAVEMLAVLREVAVQTAGLEGVAVDISGVMDLAGARFREGEELPRDFLRFLKEAGRKWYGGICALSSANHKLAFDIAFNMDIPGQHEVASELYEAVVDLESGANRSCVLMCSRALGKALARKGARADAPLSGRLAWARAAGLLGARELAMAESAFGAVAEGDGEAGGLEDVDEADECRARLALRATIRLAGMILAAEIEAGMAGAMGEFFADQKSNDRPAD